MTDTAKRPTVRMQPSRHKRVAHGHPWAFSNEIQMDTTAKAIAPGSVVRLVTHTGAPLGAATFNPHTLIAARVLTPDTDAAIDRPFLADRLARARTLRDRLFERPFYRLIHAEADGLPALVIDRYDDVSVVQANSAGMERLLPDLLGALDDVLAPRAVVLRHDSPARGLEGLASEVSVVKGAVDGPVRVEENGAVFFAAPADGQKTGWFYDQRDNRAFVAGLARDARVLDVYSYNGGFAVLCAVRGAERVVAVDRSEAALDLGRQAAEANRVADICEFRKVDAFAEIPRFAHDLGRQAAEANRVADICEFRKVDAFAELERMAGTDERFGLVISDPPAFVKSKKDLAAGARGYRKLTRLSAAVTAPGGFLMIASCSHNMTPDLFAEQVSAGLQDSGRTGRILRTAGAAPDHPVHPRLPETAYLKAMVLQLD